MGSVKLLVLLACAAALVQALPRNYEPDYNDLDNPLPNYNDVYPEEYERDERETELTKKVDYTVNKIFHVLERFCKTFKFKFCKSTEMEPEMEPMPIKPAPMPMEDSPVQNFLNYDNNLNQGY